MTSESGTCTRTDQMLIRSQQLKKSRISQKLAIEQIPTPLAERARLATTVKLTYIKSWSRMLSSWFYITRSNYKGNRCIQPYPKISLGVPLRPISIRTRTPNFSQSYYSISSFLRIYPSMRIQTLRSEMQFWLLLSSSSYGATIAKGSITAKVHTFDDFVVNITSVVPITDTNWIR